MSRKSRRWWRDWGEYLAFRVVVCVIDALSPRLCARFADGLAWIMVRLLPRKLTRYEVARANLRTAFGPELSDARVDEIIGRMWAHLFRLIVEMVHVRRKFRLADCADIVHFQNRDATVRALCSGRPVIFVSGHFGNWEVAVSTFGLFGFPMGIVARDLDNPYLHAWFERMRRRTGHRIISKQGGGREMVALLEHRGHLALLGDQDAGRKGLFVEFFGRPASTFKSIALLAREYRALLCVGYALRLPEDFRRNRWVRFELGCEEIIDPLEFDGPDAVREITQRYTRALERAVRRAPEQYFWVHRRWKSVPAKRRAPRPPGPFEPSISEAPRDPGDSAARSPSHETAARRGVRKAS